MKITLVWIGKKEGDEMERAVFSYEKRLKHYVPFEVICAGKPRVQGSITPDRHREHEAEILVKWIEGMDLPVLLDERGRQMPSLAFSQFIQQTMNRGIRHMGFIIGGAYGFSDKIYQEVKDKISLSPMTFSHKLARLVFVEQLYRAMTILHGESYHHL